MSTAARDVGLVWSMIVQGIVTGALHILVKKQKGHHLYAIHAVKRIRKHVSGPWWTDGSKGEEACLRSCYAKALQLAKDYGCNSIAFPLLATGTYGFPKELGIQIAVDTFTDFLEDNDIEIR